MDGARGAVEIPADLAPLVGLDQRLQGGVVGGRGLAHQGRTRRQAGAKQAQEGAAVGAVAEAWASRSRVNGVSATP